ncbi:MAG: hypothetical protein AAFQ74_16625 [Cyanobacteria bacterium J06623_4]
MVDYYLQLAFILMAKAIVWLRPFLPFICIAVAWGTLILTVWHLFTGLRQGVSNVRQLHKIPCATCRYANCSHHLKCSVQPLIAFSEQAIGCQDFEPAEQQYSTIL